MKATRPVYLNLWRIRFPIPAIVSILHRISGVVIFLALPWLLYLLNQSLISQESFNHLTLWVTQPLVKCGLWIILSALAGHVLAGVRHILMDMGIAENLDAGRLSAYGVLIITAAIIVLLGIWLWV